MRAPTRTVSKDTSAPYSARVNQPTPHRSPIVVAWRDAVATILAAARARESRVVIGVTGAVAAGKSTLARKLSPLVVSTDHYLPDYDLTPEPLRDVPESSDLPRLARDLASLASGASTLIPRWSFDSHSRVGEQRIESAHLIVCEGLHALHAIPRAYIDIAVFVQSAQAVRWQRAQARELAGERGWSMEYVEHFFHTVADPTFARVAERYRATADFIVVNDDSE